MTGDPHLVLKELVLLPSGEWFTQSPGWVVVRVSAGAGYWLHQGVGRDLGVGDMVVAESNCGGTVRASSLGPLTLQFFIAQPRLLNGLLAVTEWRQLEKGTAARPPQPLFSSANEPFAQRFTELAVQPVRLGLPMRCRLLQLWVDAVAGLVGETSRVADAGELRDRFLQMLGRMSEAELSVSSLSDLSQRLHCSGRHFSRLFREEFGTAFRVRQIEMRLLRAQQMLTESDAKIIHIAYECGYNHLGLFNAMFKKHFGMTPSQWRLRSRKTSPARPVRLAARAGVFLFALLLNYGGTAAEQTNAPAPAAAAALKFEVRAFIVHGNTLLKKETIESIFAPAKGSDVTLDQIRKAMGNLQTAYRERGFPTVAVTLPQQQLTNATVIVQVIEAPLTQVNVVNNRFYSSNNVMRALPSLQDMNYWTNFVLNSQVLQREVDLANANRDRQIYPILGPGPEPGTSELTLKVKDRLPLHGRFELNNQYTPGTPQMRMNLNAQYGNLWDHDHQLGLQYSFTPEELKATSLHKFSFLDEPLIANYSGYYRIPLGGVASVQQQIDANPLDFGYNEVTHQFRMPPATGRPELTLFASRSTTDTGIKFSQAHTVTNTPLLSIVSQDSGEDVTLNEGMGSRLSLPLPEVAGIRSTLSLGFDFKRFRLASFNTNNFYITTTITNSAGSQTIRNTVSSGQPTHNAAVDYLPFNAGLDLSIPDKRSTTFLNASANFNPLHSPSNSGQRSVLSGDADFAHAAYTTNASAGYVTLNFGLSREEKFYKDWSVLFRANGQWADGPLISNEQFAMGGLAGVRGYIDGEAYGDSGWRVQVEPRTPLVNLGMVDGTVPFWLRGSVFMDYGEVYLNVDSPGDSSSRQFWGVGLGVTATIGDHVDARLSIAWPLLDGPQRRAGDAHIYFALGAQF